MLADVSQAQFLRDFDLMGLQRHLKVMGIFADSASDNKSRYLADIPLVIQYFLEVSRRYPELGDFVEWFNRRHCPLRTSGSRSQPAKRTMRAMILAVAWGSVCSP